MFSLARKARGRQIKSALPDLSQIFVVAKVLLLGFQYCGQVFRKDGFHAILHKA